MKTMNKENITELNLNEMKEINGGYGPKDFLSDLTCCLVLGPVGEGIVVAKHIVGAYH